MCCKYLQASLQTPAKCNRLNASRPSHPEEAFSGASGWLPTCRVKFNPSFYVHHEVCRHSSRYLLLFAGQFETLPSASPNTKKVSLLTGSHDTPNTLPVSKVSTRAAIRKGLGFKTAEVAENNIQTSLRMRQRIRLSHRCGSRRFQTHIEGVMMWITQVASCSWKLQSSH